VTVSGTGRCGSDDLRNYRAAHRVTRAAGRQSRAHCARDHFRRFADSARRARRAPARRRGSRGRTTAAGRHLAEPAADHVPRCRPAIVPLPERRRDLVKVVKRLGEDARVAVRNIRRDANERFKKLEKEHELSQDAMHDKQDAIQKLTDGFIKKVDDAVAGKEKEVLEM